MAHCCLGALRPAVWGPLPASIRSQEHTSQTCPWASILQTVPTLTPCEITSGCGKRTDTNQERDALGSHWLFLEAGRRASRLRVQLCPVLLSSYVPVSICHLSPAVLVTGHRAVNMLGKRVPSLRSIPKYGLQSRPTLTFLSRPRRAGFSLILTLQPLQYWDGRQEPWPGIHLSYLDFLFQIMNCPSKHLLNSLFFIN